LHENGFPDAMIQHFGTTRDVLIRLGVHEESKGEPLSTSILRLLEKDGTDQVSMRRVEYVGPQIGGELVEKGGLAVIYTLFGILIYVAFRFEYRFALGAIAALIHDTLITVGLFSLLGLEFDLTVLAALLAMIGYSLNDTIVVFDRIRENFVKMRKQPSSNVMNTSINQMLGRTVMTSVTTTLVLIVLFVVGGSLIHGFSIALLFGVIIGTYSSIYIASASALALGVSKADLMPVQKEGAEKKV
jgi:preprotein translocase subunit SecF